MADQGTEYIRLPGRGANVAGITRLWLGRDHVLSVTNYYISETYQRFYFRDIQGFVLRRTAVATVVNAVSLAMMGVISLTGWMIGGGAGIVFGVAFGGPFLLIFAVNVMRGPTCVCYIQTAVQHQRLRSLGRVRTTRAVIGRLRPLIEAVQGRLTEEHLLRYREESVEEPSRVVQPQSGRRTPDYERLPPYY